MPPVLSVDDFERAIDRLELAHFDAVKAWWDEQTAGACVASAHARRAARRRPWLLVAAPLVLRPLPLWGGKLTARCGCFAAAAAPAAGPSTWALQVPRIPGMKQLLPRAAALEALAPLLPDKKLAGQLLDYWLRKRQAEGGPLLARLWFEQPWKVR